MDKEKEQVQSDDIELAAEIDTTPKKHGDGKEDGSEFFKSSDSAYLGSPTDITAESPALLRNAQVFCFHWS